ncbi:Pycsar system effector family protein [Streptomyces sp. NPDC090077]|uniref:Pycsar system effector family protein n=1 Tax=Streptomyces sp. NPDC090077 TaxID=3365938 RepID=UPI0037F7FFC7
MGSPTGDGAVDSALAEVRVELLRADQKAATLLALFSAIAAGVVTVFLVRRGGIFSLWNGIEWAAWTGAGCLAASVALLLLCVRPQGARQPTGHAYFTFYALYAGRPDQLATHLASVGSGGTERPLQLVALSLLVQRKYRMIAGAVDLLGASLVLVAGAALVSALH